MTLSGWDFLTSFHTLLLIEDNRSEKRSFRVIRYVYFEPFGGVQEQFPGSSRIGSIELSVYTNDAVRTESSVAARLTAVSTLAPAKSAPRPNDELALAGDKPIR